MNNVKIKQYIKLPKNIKRVMINNIMILLINILSHCKH
jgi:hypothetical protein